MKKTSFLIVCVFFTIMSIQAQDTLFGPVNTVANIRSISDNGRYLAGQTTGRIGYTWNIRSGNSLTLTSTTYSAAFGVTNDNFVVGNFTDPDLLYEGTAIASGGYWENGNWTGLGLGVSAGSPPVNISAGSSVHAVTSDKNTIAGHSSTFPSSQRVWPYSWSNNNGTWEGTTWAEPSDVRQGSSIIDISGNGSIAVGWTNIERGLGATRSAILWKSPTEYELLYIGEDLASEYTCVSRNGNYAGFKISQHAGFYDVENDEYTLLPEAFQINGISDNGIAVGVYRSPAGTDKGFIWSYSLGFMDFGEFVDMFITGVTFPAPLATAFEVNNTTNSYSLNKITPDGLSIALSLTAPRIQQAFVIKMATPFEIIPFPRNLSADVSRPDRNTVTLSWDAPSESWEQPLTAYYIYQEFDSIAAVGAGTLTYTIYDAPAGQHNYYVQAVYGDVLSRKSDKAEVTIVDNYDIPFEENFDSENLATNFWTTEAITGRSLWLAYDGAGVEGGTGLAMEAPNSQGAFSTALVSKPLDATNFSTVYLSYMLFLRDTISSYDTVFVEVYDGNIWETVESYTLEPGRIMDWRNEIVDLSEHVAGTLFNFRLRINGINNSTDTRFYFFDDFNVSSTRPGGEAVPRMLIAKEIGNEVRLAWKDPAGLFGITHAKTPTRSAFGNLGVSFIAAQDFSSDELAVYDGMFLTSISVFVHENILNPSVETLLRLAVFQNGVRVDQTDVTDFTVRAWNTFNLDNPVHINGDITNLKIGIEVVEHDADVLPIGADEEGRVVKRKGDLYSEDGGATWKYLSDQASISSQRNWSIIGNISELENRDVERTPEILGYNVYFNGEKINEDLIYGQHFTTQRSGGCYTVRAYSLISGTSGESNEICNNAVVGIDEPWSDNNSIMVYPNPAQDQITIDGEFDYVIIYDINGKKISQTEHQKRIAVNHLHNGIYVIVVNTPNGIHVQKLVINK